MWSKTHVLFEVNIFHLEPPTALQVTDLTFLPVPGEGSRGGASGSLTSSSPAGAAAGPGCTRAARTWGRAWRQSRGCRQLTAREANQRLRANSQSEETLSYWRQQ